MKTDGHFPTTAQSETAQTWLRRIEALHPTEIDLGLDRLSLVAQRLGLVPDPADRQIIMVAGTNGKGSTVRAIEALCVSQGLPCAAYTSPHLVDFGERLRFQGVATASEAWVPYFERVERARVGQAAKETVSLTFFEFTTLAAFLMLADSVAKIWILEIGLGGRLDAVNWLNASVAIVTRIAKDHEAWLGDNLAGIAREKCGIFRAKRPAIWADLQAPAEVVDAVKASAEQHEVARLVTPTAFGYRQRGQVNTDLVEKNVEQNQALTFYGIDGQGRPWEWETPMPEWAQSHAHALQGDVLEGGAPQCNVLQVLMAQGRLHPSAWAAALQACALFMPQWEAVKAAVWPKCWENTRLAGRFDVEAGHVSGPAGWIYDVAHNLDAITVLIEKLTIVRHRAGLARVVCVFGVMADKPWQDMLERLLPWVSQWLFVTPDSPRSVPAQTLAQALEKRLSAESVGGHRSEAVSILPGPPKDWRGQVQARIAQDDFVLVCGSFFTVGPFYADDKQSD